MCSYFYHTTACFGQLMWLSYKIPGLCARTLRNEFISTNTFTEEVSLTWIFKKKSSSDFVPQYKFWSMTAPKVRQQLKQLIELRLRVYERDIWFIIRMKTTLQTPCIHLCCTKCFNHLCRQLSGRITIT